MCLPFVRFCTVLIVRAFLWRSFCLYLLPLRSSSAVSPFAPLRFKFSRRLARFLQTEPICQNGGFCTGMRMDTESNTQIMKHTHFDETRPSADRELLSNTKRRRAIVMALKHTHEKHGHALTQRRKHRGKDGDSIAAAQKGSVTCCWCQERQCSRTRGKQQVV